MYVMAMFMVTWVSYLVIKIVDLVLDEEKVTNKIWGEFLGAIIFSALTHYYCVMYIVLIEIVFFLFLLLSESSPLSVITS